MNIRIQCVSLFLVAMLVLICHKGQAETDSETFAISAESEHSSLTLLLSDMMQNYMFMQDKPSSQVLELSVSPITFLGPHGEIISFTKSYIWWPGMEYSEVVAEEIFGNIIIPTVRNHAFISLSDARKRKMHDWNVFQKVYKLQGLDAWKIYLFRPPVHILGADRLSEDTLNSKEAYEERLRKAIDNMGVCFQKLEVNKAVLRAIAEKYDEFPQPLGIYLEYYIDPVTVSLY